MTSTWQAIDTAIQYASGDELDRALAEHLMNWHLDPRGNRWLDAGGDPTRWYLHGPRAWHPSTDLYQAWRNVATKIRDQWYFITTESCPTRMAHSHRVIIRKQATSEPIATAQGETIELALCRAALALIEARQ